MKYVGGFSKTELRRVMESLFGEDLNVKELCMEGTESLGKQQMLRQFYAWDDDGQVELALEDSPCLTDLLIEAIPYIMHVFGPEVECMLAAFGVTDAPQDRVVFIGLHIDDAEGMNGKLREFLGLFRDKLGKLGSKLCVDLIAEEMVAPGITVGRVLRVVPNSNGEYQA